MAGEKAFNEHADRYDAWFERHADFYKQELEVIQSLWPEKTTKSLEVGVGSGKFAIPLGITHGIDPTLSMLKRIKSDKIEVTQGKAEKLPYHDAFFDLLLMVTTICFVDNLDQTLSEAYRVLKPEGFLIVGFVDKDSKLGQSYLAHKEQSAFYKEATFYNTKEVLEHLTTAGFQDPKIRQTLFSQQTSLPYKDSYGEGAFVVIRVQKSLL